MTARRFWHLGRHYLSFHDGVPVAWSDREGRLCAALYCPRCVAVFGLVRSHPAYPPGVQGYIDDVNRRQRDGWTE